MEGLAHREAAGPRIDKIVDFHGVRRLREVERGFPSEQVGTEDIERVVGVLRFQVVLGAKEAALQRLIDSSRAGDAAVPFFSPREWLPQELARV